MVLEIPRSPARRARPRAAVATALEKPRHRPAAPVDGAQDDGHDDGAVRWERIDIDRYVVRAAGATAGFVDVVGQVFVVLAGSRYDQAVEVRQTLDFAAAVATIAPAGADDRA